MGRIAILGGTFDPVHWGHLLLAETALSQIALERVIWVPDRCPPHKRAAGFEHRWEMVQQAIADNPAFASHMLAKRDPTYAVQTLIDLQALYQNTDWYWIVGLDAFQTLPRWHRQQELAAACDWLVVPRSVSPTSKENEPAAMTTAEIESSCQQVAQQLATETSVIRWQLLQMPTVGVSSSLIRQHCRDRRSIRYLVPETTRSYIATYDLYLHQPE